MCVCALVSDLFHGGGAVLRQSKRGGEKLLRLVTKLAAMLEEEGRV